MMRASRSFRLTRYVNYTHFDVHATSFDSLRSTHRPRGLVRCLFRISHSSQLRYHSLAQLVRKVNFWALGRTGFQSLKSHFFEVLKWTAGPTVFEVYHFFVISSVSERSILGTSISPLWDTRFNHGSTMAQLGIHSGNHGSAMAQP